METIIGRLVGFDEAGQELVEEAREQSDKELAQVDAEKKKMHEKYLAECERRVKLFHEQAKLENEDKILRMRSAYEASSAHLREEFEQNSETWLHKILDRCLGAVTENDA